MGSHFQDRKRTKTFRLRLILQTVIFIPVRPTQFNIPLKPLRLELTLNVTELSWQYDIFYLIQKYRLSVRYFFLIS